MSNHQAHVTGTQRNERYFAQHDWQDVGSLRESIVGAVAAATNTDATVVAADYGEDHSRSVERLFGGATDDEPRSYGVVRFTLAGSVVTVHSDGRLVVETADEAATRRAAVG